MQRGTILLDNCRAVGDPRRYSIITDVDNDYIYIWHIIDGRIVPSTIKIESPIAGWIHEVEATDILEQITAMLQDELEAAKEVWDIVWPNGGMM